VGKKLCCNTKIFTVLLFEFPLPVVLVAVRDATEPVGDSIPEIPEKRGDQTEPLKVPLRKYFSHRPQTMATCRGVVVSL